MSKASTSKPARQSHLQWVSADALKTNPAAQREFRVSWAQAILSQFDLDKMQVPHVSRRADGSLYIMEGQHTVWAYRQWIGEGQQIQVWLYEGLTEQDEAEFFLSFNNKKAVDALSKFKTGVTAGREVECDIDRIVRANGCTIGTSANPTSISAVGALTTIYSRFGGPVLGQTLRVIRDSFADGGYERPVLLGIAQVLARYPEADVARIVLRLGNLRNGWKGLVQKTNSIKEATGQQQADCAAAAVVELYNAGKGGKKLPSWWRDVA